MFIPNHENNKKYDHSNSSPSCADSQADACIYLLRYGMLLLRINQHNADKYRNQSCKKAFIILSISNPP